MPLRARWRRAGACVGLAVVALLPACAPETVPAAPESRSATTPTPTTEPTAEEARHDRAAAMVDALSTRERAAAVLMATVPTTDPGEAARFVAEHRLGGLILMPSNIATPEQLAALTAAITSGVDPPPLIATDQEGGFVSRLAWDPTPGPETLRTLEPDEVRQAYDVRADVLAAAGVTVNFGIVADVAPDASGFMHARQLGLGFDDAAARVAAAVTGERSSGLVASTLKHFPGHGAAPGDSHTTVPTAELTMDDWRATHAQPFIAGIAAGADLLMFGHLTFPAVDPAPATLSPSWHGIAREALGFTGVIVSDDLGMLLDSGRPEFADLPTVTVAALAAGTDLALLVRANSDDTVAAVIDGVAAAADAGSLPAERLREAAVRVTELRLRFAEAALRD